MEFLTNNIALNFVDKLTHEVHLYENISEGDFDIHTTLKYIFAMAVDIQIYLTANEMVSYESRNPRLVYLVTVYNHVDGNLSETYATYELSIALELFKIEFLNTLDNYYSLREE